VQKWLIFHVTSVTINPKIWNFVSRSCIQSHEW